MLIAETKIYLKFIVWFLFVAILPIIVLLIAIFRSDPNNPIFQEIFSNNFLASIFFTLALVFILALLVARRFSKLITRPVQISVADLLKVVNTLKKTMNNLVVVNKNNKEVAKFLVASAKKEQLGLKSGNKAVEEIAQSLHQITNKIDKTTQNTFGIDKLVDDSEQRAQAALSGLVAVKQLSTENQKLNAALDGYADKIQIIAQRVESMADVAKYLSLNATIEANKTVISEEFNGLVNQIRQLNIISQQAATSIKDLMADMQRQLKQTKAASAYEIQETDKNIGIIGQTIQFLTKITNKTKQISQDIKIIHKETKETQQAADQVTGIIANLNTDSKSLNKEVRQINQVVDKQLWISRSLNRSFNTLHKAVDNLDKLVGKV
jgi:methyl-accepting chemotaxis protein